MNKIAIIVFSSDKKFERILDCLNKSENIDIKLLITQPPKPSGRGMSICHNYAHQSAIKENIPVQSPEILNKDFASSLEFSLNDLRDSGYDVLGFVFAYGKIIPEQIIDIFDHKIINLHPSLLPKYRGPSPIQSAILNGERESGYSLIEISEKCDCGDILYSKKIEIEANDNYLTYRDKVIDHFCNDFPRVASDYLQEKISPKTQKESESTKSRIIRKNDGEITNQDTAESAFNKFRAYYNWPKTFIMAENKRLIIHDAVIDNDVLIIKKIQVEGKNIISDKEFANGYSNLLTLLPKFVTIGKN